MKPFLDSADGAKSWYLTLSDRPIHRTLQLTSTLVLDVAEDGTVVGIEGFGRVRLPKSLNLPELEAVG